MRVLSFGGGVNSTAALLALVERGQAPDWCLFADTGGELPATYAHVATMRAWAAERGIKWATVTNAGRGQGDSLEDCSLRRKELPSLAYGLKGCSTKWKRQPMDRYIRDEIPAARAEWDAGRKVERCIGIDAGERHRAVLTADTRYAYRYPLVEFGIDRDGCAALIEAAGLAVPPKSACFFCPARRKHEVLALAEQHPDLFARAVAIERNAVTTVYADGKLAIRGLGRSFAWGELVAADKRQGKLFVDTVGPQPCGCHDDSDDD